MILMPMVLQDTQILKPSITCLYPSWNFGLTFKSRTLDNVEYAKDELKVKRLFAAHAIDNVASGKIIKKIGFTYQKEGTYSSFDGSRTFQSKEYIMNI